jgi:DNA-directed RNA polymerase subunit beta'
VAELFEARRPKDCAVIAEMDGRVEFGKDYKNKRRIKITPDVDADGNQAEPVEFLIPKGKHIAVHDGDFISRGEYIIDGNPDPHDILRILGVEALANFLVDEIQEVLPTARRADQRQAHRVIVRQMLQKVEILDPGDTGLIKATTSTSPNSTSSRIGPCRAAAAAPPPSRFCWASPRPACRPRASSRPRRSRKPRAS